MLTLSRSDSDGGEGHSFNHIIGRSPAMQRIYEILDRVAPGDATVLLSGRTGTGKELVARAIHSNSPRASKRFVDIDCGALPEHLVESELFGHHKGAFTGATENNKGLFQTAHGGTLFLDEVQALKLELQAKLLRALQERVIRPIGGRANRHVDIRVIAATNHNIGRAVREGRFREDLYYRLNVINISLPELRERREDIPLLIDYFLKHWANSQNQPMKHFSKEAMLLLLSYTWPGNVRELKNAVEYALTMGAGRRLAIADLPHHISGLSCPQRARETSYTRDTLQEVERQHILRILEEAGGNRVRAAEILGIDRRTLYRKLHKYRADGAKEEI